MLQSVIFLKICECRAEKDANCLPASGLAALLEGALGCSQQRQSSARRGFSRLRWGKRDQNASAAWPKVWKLWRTGSRNIPVGFRAGGGKSFSLCRTGIYLFIFKMFYWSCRLLQNCFAACSYSKCPKTGHFLSLHLFLLVLPWIQSGFIIQISPQCGFGFAFFFPRLCNPVFLFFGNPD